VDENGNAFIGGPTPSADFPVTPGAYLTTRAGSGQPYVFATKLNPQGSGLVYSTYIGLTSGNQVFLRLGPDGTAFVSGTTDGKSLNSSGVLARMSADGSSLIYSIPVVTANTALDVDAAGNAVIAGTVPGASLPVGIGAFQPAYAGGVLDGYVARYTPDGQFSGGSYVGGSQADEVAVIALRPDGSVVVAGETVSPDFPGVEQPLPPSGAEFVTSFFVSLTVENAASYVATQIASGEIVSLRGYGIGPGTGVTAAGSVLPAQLGGVELLFGGFPAPLLYVQAGQINAQVPWELAGTAASTLQVVYAGLATPPGAAAGTPLVLAPSLPGIFGVINSDSTQNSATNPASPGDFISIYGTGGGLTNPAGVTGAMWPVTQHLALLTQPVTVTIGGENARVLYAGESPLSSSGVFQINVIVPADLQPASGAGMTVKIGDQTSAAVLIAIGAP